MDMKVSIMEYPKEKDWNMVKTLALNTVGKLWTQKTGNKIPLDWKIKMLNCRHSPIRYLNFVISMEIPSFVSVHYVRHKIGVEHFVQSQRNDRQDKYDRKKAPQDSPVRHIMYVNAQGLMTIMNARLCTMADIDTRKVASMIRQAVLNVCPEFSQFLVPNCKHLGRCPEFTSCGLVDK